jgi:hypothetical protein
MTPNDEGERRSGSGGLHRHFSRIFDTLVVSPKLQAADALQPC